MWLKLDSGMRVMLLLLRVLESKREIRDQTFIPTLCSLDSVQVVLVEERRCWNKRLEERVRVRPVCAVWLKYEDIQYKRISC